MNDTDGNGAVGWVVIALVVVAIVLLVLFVRGPEGHEHAAIPILLTAVRSTDA
jgi:hypothetical protein